MSARPISQTGVPLRPEGASRPEPVDLGADPPALSDRFSRGTTLSDLEEEYAFFHHGLLLAVLNCDLVRQYYDESGLSRDAPCQLFLGRAMFIGLPPPHYQTIYVVRREIWVGLAAYLDQASPVRRDQKLYFNVFRQALPLADMLHVAQHPGIVEKDVPQVVVNMIGLDGNQQLFHWMPSSMPVGPLRLRKDPPRPSTARFARALFEMRSNPFEASRRDGSG